MPETTLSQRQLNRALLARQGLLERGATPVPAMLERLVGMQAQVPSNPYVALWSRLRDFRPEALSDLIGTRAAVRAQTLRATIHLHTAADCLAVQPITQSVLDRTFHSAFTRRMGGVDPEPVAAAGRALLAGAPLTRAELVPELAPRWPGAQFDALAQAVAYRSALVQVPPRGLWRQPGQARWSQDPDTPAPPRFLPEYDNLALSHQDRSRVLAGLGPGEPFPRGTWIGSLLVDGFYRATRSLAEERAGATLTVDRFVPRAGDPPGTRDAIAEGRRTWPRSSRRSRPRTASRSRREARKS